MRKKIATAIFFDFILYIYSPSLGKEFSGLSPKESGKTKTAVLPCAYKNANAVCRNYFIKLFMKRGLNQTFNKFFKAVDCINFIGTVSNNCDCCAGCDSHRKNAEKALCADTAVIFLNPNRAFKRICLLYEECCRSCMKTNAVFDGDVA